VHKATVAESIENTGIVWYYW